MRKSLLLFFLSGLSLVAQGRGDPNWHTLGPPVASPPASCSGSGSVSIITDGTYRICVGSIFKNPFSAVGVTSLGGLTGALIFVNDTNITVTPSGSTLTLGFTSTLAKGRQNATTVYTDQAETFGAFLFDFSASTIKIPSGAGCSASSTSMLCYDSTNKNPHIYANATDAIAAVFASAAGITNGDCAQISLASGFLKIVSAGGPCTVGGGGGTVSGGTANEFAYYPASSNTVASSGKAIPSGDVVGTTDTQTLSGKTFTNPSLGAASGPSAQTQRYLNDVSIGTASKLVVRLSATANDTAVQVGGSDSDALGICISGCGASGSGQIAIAGTATCTFDNATTDGDWVQYTAATANCHDAGATRPTSGTMILGRVTDSGSAGDHRVAVQVQALGGGTGSGTTTGAFASNPGTCTNGDVRFPSDSFYLLRCQSNAWVPWGPLFPMTDPTIPSWSWVNQGASTVSTTNGGIFLQGEATAGFNINGRYSTAPATPYTITAAFLPLLPAVGNPQAGLSFRDSGTGKSVDYYVRQSSGFLDLRVQKSTNPTTFSGTYTLTVASQAALTGLIWLRVRDDGTNFKFFTSNDGQNFLQQFSVSRTDFLASPNQMGFFVNSNSAAMTLVSWLQQ